LFFRGESPLFFKKNANLPFAHSPTNTLVDLCARWHCLRIDRTSRKLTSCVLLCRLMTSKFICSILLRVKAADQRFRYHLSQYMHTRAPPDASYAQQVNVYPPTARILYGGNPD
jgi:hypothetical protein